MNSSMIIYEDPTFYKAYTVFSFLIGVPIDFFTLWMIFTVSADVISTYRWHLALQQSLSTAFDLLAHGAVPEFFFPTLSATVHGPFYQVLGISMKNLVILCALILPSMIIGCFQCFAYRHWLLLSNDHLLKFTPFNFGICLLVHYILFLTSTIGAVLAFPIDCGHDSPSLIDIVNRYPMYAFLLTSSFDVCNTKWVALYPPQIMMASFWLLIIVILVILSYIIPVSCVTIWHSFHILKDKSVFMSQKTVTMHKRYFNTLIQGVSVPVITIGVPLIAYVIIVTQDLIVGQAFINLMVGIMYSHTKFSSFNIVFSSKLYRNYILRMGLKIMGREIPTNLIMQTQYTNVHREKSFSPEFTKIAKRH